MNFVEEDYLFLVLELTNYPLEKYRDEIEYRNLVNVSYQNFRPKDLLENILNVCKNYNLKIKDLNFSRAELLDKKTLVEIGNIGRETESKRSSFLKKVLNNIFTEEDLRELLKLISVKEYQHLLTEINFKIIIDKEGRSKMTEKLDSYIEAFISDKIRKSEDNYLTFSKHKDIALTSLYKDFKKLLLDKHRR